MNNKITHPLFHPKTLNNTIRNFTFPQDLDQRHALVKNWLEPLKAVTLNEIKEVSLHGEFLTNIFQEVLGYASVISGGGKAWEIHAETRSFKSRNKKFLELLQPNRCATGSHQQQSPRSININSSSINLNANYRISPFTLGAFGQFC